MIRSAISLLLSSGVIRKRQINFHEILRARPLEWLPYKNSCKRSADVFRGFGAGDAGARSYARKTASNNESVDGGVPAHSHLVLVLVLHQMSDY
jgi:hypothetical protein